MAMSFDSNYPKIQINKHLLYLLVTYQCQQWQYVCVECSQVGKT